MYIDLQASRSLQPKAKSHMRQVQCLSKVETVAYYYLRIIASNRLFCRRWGVPRQNSFRGWTRTSILKDLLGQQSVCRHREVVGI
jgi:hypothetical protein